MNKFEGPWYSGRIEQNTEIGETIQRVYKPTESIVK